MTASFDIWSWFDAVNRDPTLRADGEVVVFAGNGTTERVRFLLSRLLPIRVKAPQLNAELRKRLEAAEQRAIGKRLAGGDPPVEPERARDRAAHPGVRQIPAYRRHLLARRFRL